MFKGLNPFQKPVIEVKCIFEPVKNYFFLAGKQFPIFFISFLVINYGIFDLLTTKNVAVYNFLRFFKRLS